MKDIILTNNLLAAKELSNIYKVIYMDVSFNDLMKAVRDFVHKGHSLLTHPLSGSVKPNENPFKSVMLSGKKVQCDFESIRIIENAVLTAEKFPVKFKNLTEPMRLDFQTIDLSLISSCR